MSAIVARGVRKVFGTGALAFEALRGVDMTVEVGEVVILQGPSGSGKTTLLSILGCVLTATEGTVTLLGQEITAVSPRELPRLRLERIGFIFQGHNLLASLDAMENVMLPLTLRGWTRAEAKVEAKALLEQVGLGDKLTSMPSQLSGGQRQRVAVARAVAGSPPVLLADEPTASLDAEAGRVVTELLRDLAKAHGHTVIIVTHDTRIFHLADRIIAIEDGRIVPTEAHHS